MSRKNFDDECPGCRPALIDAKSGKVYAPDSVVGKVLAGVWADSFKQEREAFHRVTCHNSRSPSDMRLAQGLVDRIRLALEPIMKDLD